MKVCCVAPGGILKSFRNISSRAKLNKVKSQKISLGRMASFILCCCVFLFLYGHKVNDSPFYMPLSPTYPAQAHGVRQPRNGPSEAVRQKKKNLSFPIRYLFCHNNEKLTVTVFRCSIKNLTINSNKLFPNFK